MVTWNKIYRGGVQRTTPETLEANAPATGSLLPGQCATVSAAGAVVLGAVVDQFFYIVGEPMYGTVNDQLAVAGADTVRMYSPSSGQLYAARLAAGVPIVNDTPLAIGANGFLGAAVEDGPVHAYLDVPDNAYPLTTGTSTAGQLLPIKIK